MAVQGSRLFVPGIEVHCNIHTHMLLSTRTEMYWQIFSTCFSNMCQFSLCVRLTGDNAVFIRAVWVDEFLLGLLRSLLEHPDELLKSLVDHRAGLTGRRCWTFFQTWTQSRKFI